MSQPIKGDSLDLERRLLSAARREQPSRELSMRMARGIGVSPAALGSGASSTLPNADPAAAGSGAAGTGVAGSNAVLGLGTIVPWVATGLVVAAIAATAALLRQPGRAQSDAPVLSQRAGTILSPTSASAAIAAVAAAPSVNSSDVVVAAPDILPVAPSPQRSRSKSPDPDLREQIALLDSARSALAKGTGERTLEVLRQYQNKFPNGAFRPEATVLRIEALSRLGRHSEARTLAARFIAEHRGTPIADRVARIVSKTDGR